jgi:hypothetical protein
MAYLNRCGSTWLRSIALPCSTANLAGCVALGAHGGDASVPRGQSVSACTWDRTLGWRIPPNVNTRHPESNPPVNLSRSVNQRAREFERVANGDREQPSGLLSYPCSAASKPRARPGAGTGRKPPYPRDSRRLWWAAAEAAPPLTKRPPQVRRGRESSPRATLFITLGNLKRRFRGRHWGGERAGSPAWAQTRAPLRKRP